MTKATLPPVIVVVNLKGGAGKTTLAVNLATEAALHVSVVGVDLDPQESFSTWHAVATSKGKHPFPVERMAGRNLVRELADKAAGADLIVIDTPPKLGTEARAALLLATVALVPVSPGATDLWALGPTIDLIREVHSVRPFKALAVVNQGDKRVMTAMCRDAIASTGLALAETTVRRYDAYSAAMAEGEGVTTWGPKTNAAFDIRHLTREALS